MKVPAGLQELLDDGIIDAVVRQLKSGKEASVYAVRCGLETRCAKVYKDMAQRSFQQRAQYQEGRKVRGSRQARAMAKSSRYGRKEQEAAWKNAEVDALYQLTAAGVRVSASDSRAAAAQLAGRFFSISIARKTPLLRAPCAATHEAIDRIPASRDTLVRVPNTPSALE